MHYELKAETAHFNLKGMDIGASTVQDRIMACEKEIAAVLEKYGCILIVQVAAKEITK